MAQKTRVFKVMVAANVAHDATGVADLANGELLIVNSKTGAPLTPGDTVENAESIMIVQGGAGTNRYFSHELQGVNISSYKGSEYAAAVAQVVTVVLPATTAEGTYSLIIVDKEDKDILQRRQDKTVVGYYSSGTGNTDAMGAYFEEKINNDPNARFTAAYTSGSDTLVLTAIMPEDSDLDLAGQFPLIPFAEVFLKFTDAELAESESGTITYTTPPGFGSGTYQQVHNLENQSQGYLGITNRRKFPIPVQLYFAVAGTNYDLYVIESNDVHNAGDIQNDVASPITTIVAIPDASTTAGAYFEDIMNPWMASTPKQFAPINIVA